MAIAERLADFALTARPAASARAMMRLSLFDWAVCGVAGRDEPVSRAVRGLAIEDGGTPEATVIGASVRLPARAAAWVNGATSHALDYDDTHFAHIGHPSVAVVPAALAVAQGTGAGAGEMLDAALVGAELSIRVGVWLGRSHYQGGFHQTATAGAFGAAAAAARLLGCDRRQAAQALGLVATRASGLKSQFGTMGKPYNAGIAAANGVEAALLAARGFISNPQGIDGAQGFGATHFGEADETALDGLGQRWCFESVSHKFHACCHGTHAALEAIATLGAPAPQAVAAVSIITHPRWLSVCNIAAPRTGLEAKFSYRFTAAMALARRDTGALDSFSDALCTDPDLVRLRDRVSVETDDRLPETAARVFIALTDGTQREAWHDLNAPMALDQRRDKLRHKAGAVLGEQHVEPLWQSTDPDCGAGVEGLASLLSG